MEKTYQLDQREAVMLNQLDQERTQVLAVIGALSLDMEQARKNLDTVAERQRAFIRQALSIRDVDRYENAKTANGTLIVTLPDERGPEAKPFKMTNGSANNPIEMTKE
jgi:hypothetical protein